MMIGGALGGALEAGILRIPVVCSVPEFFKEVLVDPNENFGPKPCRM
jgi:hypothetical protein